MVCSIFCFHDAASHAGWADSKKVTGGFRKYALEKILWDYITAIKLVRRWFYTCGLPDEGHGTSRRQSRKARGPLQPDRD